MAIPSHPIVNLVLAGSPDCLPLPWSALHIRAISLSEDVAADERTLGILGWRIGFKRCHTRRFRLRDRVLMDWIFHFN